MRLAFLLLSLATTTAAAQSGVVAFTGVTVVPMATRAVLENHTVLVANGRITAIGPADAVDLPSGARRVDGRGKYLIPGLTDAHVHLYDVNDLGLYLIHGVTTVLNMSGAPIHLEWREAVRRGDFLGPTIFTTGPQLKVEADPAVDFERSAGSPEELRMLAATQRALGYDFVKIWGAITPEQYAAFVGAATSAGLRVTGHIPRGVGLEGVIAAGQSSVAHLEEYLTKVLTNQPTNDRLSAAVRITRSGGLPVITSLVTYEAIAASLAADLTPLLARPGRALLDPVRALLWEPSYNSLRTPGPVGRDQLFRDRLADKQRIARALDSAGVPLLAGTDAGGLPGLVPGLELHRELELLVEAGLDPWAALRTVTYHPGRYLGTGADGTIAIGAVADLVLLDANPLEAITNTRRITGVMARGRYLGSEELAAVRQRLDSLNRGTGAFVAVAMAGDAAAIETFMVEAYANAPGIPPFQEAPVMLLAHGLRALGQTEAAVNLMRLVVATYLDSHLSRHMLAGTLFALGRSEDALTELDAVLRLRPDHDGAAALRARLRP